MLNSPTEKVGKANGNTGGENGVGSKHNLQEKNTVSPSLANAEGYCSVIVL